MAVAHVTVPHISDAMQNSIVRRNDNPLKNKVVHAAIRVDSIEDDIEGSEPDETSTALVEQRTPSPQDVEEQERAEEMQAWWNSEMKTHMNQPDGYAKVAVLLIRWADELDTLDTKVETIELEALFRDTFHYQTRTVELNVRNKPQHQLNKHVSNFISDYDGPHSLLIVYYTGHGVYHDDKRYLELAACDNPQNSKGFIRDAKANWNKVEEKLKEEEVEGDVLTILDTCYASNLVKKSGKREPKKFELVAACSIDQTTDAPGKYSFTRALIDGLKELLAKHKEPISTFFLVQSINLSKYRTKVPAHVWARNDSPEQHIYLAPLKPNQPNTTQATNYRAPPGSYLSLRFGLRDPCLNKEQIIYMTKTLSTALFNKKLLGLSKVEFLDFTPAPPIPHLDRIALVMYAVTQWKKVINKRREERESQATIDRASTPEPMDLSPKTSQKRAFEDAGDLPDAKRRYTDPSQPLSPPVSTSSRME